MLGFIGMDTVVLAVVVPALCAIAVFGPTLNGKCFGLLSYVGTWLRERKKGVWKVETDTVFCF